MSRYDDNRAMRKLIDRQSDAEFVFSKALEDAGVDYNRFLKFMGLTTHDFNVLAHISQGVNDEAPSPAVVAAIKRMVKPLGVNVAELKVDKGGLGYRSNLSLRDAGRMQYAMAKKPLRDRHLVSVMALKPSEDETLVSVMALRPWEDEILVSVTDWESTVGLKLYNNYIRDNVFGFIRDRRHSPNISKVKGH